MISSRKLFFFTHNALLITLTAYTSCVDFFLHKYTMETAPLNDRLVLFVSQVFKYEPSKNFSDFIQRMEHCRTMDIRQTLRH